LGKALAHRNLAVKEDLYGLRILGIYSRNRLEWFLADWACSIFGYVMSPLYDSLGKENFAHCINISGTTTLFISSQTANELCKFHQKTTLKTLVLFDKLSEELNKKLTE
jgi:long-chain acyl-CoA synthetase